MPDIPIRRLGRLDRPEIAVHFAGLDTETMRDHVARLFDLGSLAYGAFLHGRLRAVGELRRLPSARPPRVEAAFSVDHDWQDQGIGDAPFTRILAVAQNRGIRSLQMLCLRDNRRMQHLAEKHGALLHFDHSDVEATLDPPWPRPRSVSEEFSWKYNGFMCSMPTWPDSAPGPVGKGGDRTRCGFSRFHHAAMKSLHPARPWRARNWGGTEWD